MSSEIHIVDDLEQALSIPRKGIPVELLKKPTIAQLLRQAALDWSLVLLTWIGFTTLPSWTFPLLIVIAASRFHAFGVLMHDAAHMRIREKTAGVRLLEVLAGYPIATTLNAMRYHHLRHHRDSGMVTDPYFKEGIEGRPVACLLAVLRGLLLFPFWAVRCVYGSLAYYAPGLRGTYARVFLQDRSDSDPSASKEVRQCAAEDRRQLLFFVIAVPLLSLQPTVALYGYFIPAIIAGALAAHRLLMEHRYDPVEDRRIESILRTTRDHNLGGLGAFVLAPHNIGFHIVHHLHPQVAWYQLPELRRWYREAYPGGYPRDTRPAWHVLAVIAGRRAA